MLQKDAKISHKTKPSVKLSNNLSYIIRADFFILGFEIVLFDLLIIFSLCNKRFELLAREIIRPNNLLINK